MSNSNYEQEEYSYNSQRRQIPNFTIPIWLRFLIPVIFIAFFANIMLLQRVPAGFEGVKVINLGSNQGVQDQALPVGRHFCPNFFCEIHLFPTFEQNISYPSIGFQSIEGLSLQAPIGLKYQVNLGDSPKLYQQYRKGINELNQSVFYNLVNDSLNRIASNYTASEIYAGGKQKVMSEVTEYINSRISNYGVQVEQVMWAGLILLPTEVKQGIDAKIQAKQLAEQRENEIRTQEAEAKKKIIAANAEKEAQRAVTDAEVYNITQRALAQAEANDIVSKSLTQELIDYNKIEKWDGSLPKVSSETAMPLINLD